MDPEAEYAQALSRLASLARFGVKLGLTRMERVLNRLGNPEQAYRVVHLAGTNGKGSTAAFVEAGLRGAGLRTGLYTSPHLCRFTERIRVAGEEIPRHKLSALLARVEAAADPDLTFFEAITAMALLHFAEAEVELAVLETGLGGRLDATNTVTPEVAVITPIHLDHVEILGPDLAHIAAEKAGIIKPGVPTVAAPPTSPEVRRALESRAEALGSPRVRWQGEDFPAEANLPGWSVRFQRQNAALALETLEQLRQAGITIPDLAATRAMGGAIWPGRVERLGDCVVLDGAHNPAGCAALASALEGKWDIILGALGPRSPEPMMQALLPLARRFIFTRPRSPRAVAPETFPDPGPPYIVTPNLEQALSRSEISTQATLITGSLYLVGEARSLLLGESADPVDAFDPLPSTPTAKK